MKGKEIKRKATIKKIVFRKDTFYLKFGIMDKISFYPQEDINNQFSLHLLNAMRCKGYEELVGKEVVYYIVKKEDTVYFAIEEPDTENIAYTSSFKKRGLYLRKVGLK